MPTVPEVGENPVRVGAGIAGTSGSSLSLQPLHNRKKKRLNINKLDILFITGLFGDYPAKVGHGIATGEFHITSGSFCFISGECTQ